MPSRGRRPLAYFPEGGESYVARRAAGDLSLVVAGALADHDTCRAEIARQLRCDACRHEQPRQCCLPALGLAAQAMGWRLLMDVIVSVVPGRRELHHAAPQVRWIARTGSGALHRGAVRLPQRDAEQGLQVHPDSQREDVTPGKFVQGVNTGPGDMTKIVLDRKVHCKRSNAGPDPYGLNNAIGSARNSSPRSTFAPEDGSTRQPWVYGLTRGQAFDRYHVHSRNQWRHTSNSIKSILANPMPQTPRASPFRPSAFGRVLDRSPRTAGSYSRIRSAGPSAAMAGVDVARLRFGISGNPFH